MQSKSFAIFFFISALSFFFACKKNNAPETKHYRFTESITVDGTSRTYILNLPPNYYEGTDFSLVIGMHGGGGSAEQFESSTKLTTKANDSKFMVVYPDGVKSTGLLGVRTWNAGGCCDYARDNNIDDVKFISQLIDKLVSTYKINPKKVYATGHSNGGMMAYRLACELAHKIAAIAPNSTTMVVKTPCNASRAVPILHLHSMMDENVPYQGGVGKGASGHYNPPLDSVMNVWSQKNQCTNIAQVVVDNSSYKLTKWSNCSNNVTIQYYLTKDGGHAWPPSAALNTNDLLWEFFQKYQLP